MLLLAFAFKVDLFDSVTHTCRDRQLLGPGSERHAMGALLCIFKHNTDTWYGNSILFISSFRDLEHTLWPVAHPTGARGSLRRAFDPPPGLPYEMDGDARRLA